MGLYKNSGGFVVEVDDAYARAQGYEPYTGGEQARDIRTAAEEARQANVAESAPLTAFRGVASGLTLGVSDVLTAATTTKNTREEIVAGGEQHPYARTGGEVAGMFVGALAQPGSLLAKSPAGLVSRATGAVVEQGLERGGAAGTAQALAAMGTEGAVQSAGQYLGHAALGDREVTAEGLAGALGTGFGFGAAGGGAVLGLQKGTIAARRMFSRVMEGGENAAADAASAWDTQSATTLAADEETANIARRKLDDLRVARREGEAHVARQNQILREEQSRAAQPRPQAEPTAAPSEPAPQPRPGEDLVGKLLPKPAPVENVPPINEPSGLERIVQMQREAAPVESARPVVDENLRAAIGRAEGAPAPREGIQGAPKPEAFGNLPPRASEQPTINGPSPLNGPADARAAFADEVYAAARKANDAGGGFGANKAFISATYDQMNPALRGRSLDDFKELLEAARKRGDVSLSRADYVQAMDSKLVAASESKLGGIENHMVEFNRPSPNRQFGLEKPAPLGKALAGQEQRLAEALHDFEQARSTMLDRLATDAASKHALPTRGEGVGSSGVPLEFAPGKAPVAEPGTKVATPNGRRAALDEAHEAALSRAEYANTEAERVAAIKDAEHAEAQLAREDMPGDAVGDVARAAEDITNYEKASAELADAVGDQAHPTSLAQMKAFQEAQGEAARKMMDRVTRAAEDAEGPIAMSAKDRVAYAKAQKRAAEADLARVRADEVVAKNASDAAKTKFKLSKASAKPVEPPTATKKGKLGLAADIGAAAEVLDIPGLPKPHDLPVVGPLLGAYLKYRAVKAALGRFTGRVPATGDARVAALAAKTKDKIARSVDGMLGLAEKGAASAVPRAPTLAATLGRRIFDDGREREKEHASLAEKAARRVDELAAYVTTPGAIERDVRLALVDVSDPDMIAAAEKQQRASMQYLLDKAPKGPPQDPLAPRAWRPSGSQSMELGRRIEVINDPTAAFDAARRGDLTIEGSETLRANFPRLFELAQLRVMERSGELKAPLSYRQRAMATLLFDHPLDASLDPRNIRIVQEAYKPSAGGSPAMTAPGPAATPMPSVAGDVMLNKLYQTGADRAAQAR